MKIAFIGKGGSGKSSLAWLAYSVLHRDNERVLLIDADHNMDLAHNLGAAVSEQTPTLHRSHPEFLVAVRQSASARWSDIVLDGRTLPAFTLNPKDDFTRSITIAINNTTDLIVVGLGAEDILFSGKCAHGHSAPLKFYLPLLHLAAQESLIVDGVAGVDMMNFGLFNGVDAIVTVIENHPNSIRVANEVARIALHTQLPIFALINKHSASDTLPTLSLPIIGTIPNDEGIRHADSTQLNAATTEAMAIALENIRKHAPTGNGLARVQKFEAARLQARA
ncbi:hypothetical protein K2Q16_02500 [Patescibacteria group bacterium]|nr:hypothetical protein [Patescibacteria group bacterium]